MVLQHSTLTHRRRMSFDCTVYDGVCVYTLYVHVMHWQCIRRNTSISFYHILVFLHLSYTTGLHKYTNTPSSPFIGNDCAVAVAMAPEQQTTKYCYFLFFFLPPSTTTTLSHFIIFFLLVKKKSNLEFTNNPLAGSLSMYE